MEQARDCQCKGCDRRVETRAIIGFHAIQTLHGAYRRFKHSAARVTKTLTGVQVRLFTDNTIATYFLDLAVGVSNDPVTAEQLRRHSAIVGNRDRISEYVSIGIRFRLIIDITRRNLDADVELILFHGDILTYAH